MRSRCSGDSAPVPCREDIGIFISLSYDIGTSVRHEISFEVFSVAVFTTHGAGGYSTDVERIAGAYVQGIVSSEIMCMQRL